MTDTTLGHSSPTLPVSASFSPIMAFSSAIFNAASTATNPPMECPHRAIFTVPLPCPLPSSPGLDSSWRVCIVSHSTKLETAVARDPRVS